MPSYHEISKLAFRIYLERVELFEAGEESCANFADANNNWELAKKRLEAEEAWSS